MNRIIRLTTISLAAVVAFVSCIKEPADEASSKLEQRSLDAWIKLHKPHLEQNRQSEGYYVEVLDAGAGLGGSVKPLSDTTINWIAFDVNVRTLTGRICFTRDASYAKQEGTFTKYTHYVPLYRYSGESTYSLLEGTTYALRNVLNVDGSTYQARIGSRLRLYLPASIAYSSNGMSDSGGYGGQYDLDANKPVIVDLFIRDTVYNPLQREGVDADYFAEHNGGLRPLPEDDDKEDAAADDDLYAWRNAVDTVPQVYINRRYAPSVARQSFDYNTQHVKQYIGYEPYDNPAELDRKINEALIERFGDPEEHIAGDTIGTEKQARIWYIARLLDGFIVDTNIDEVKKLIYGEVTSSGSVMTYTAESNVTEAILAFYYSIPQLCYGRWAAILTTSTNAYGASGVTGGSSTSSSSTSYYDYLNYYNYMNYYNNYYGGYYNGYYNNYYNNYYGGYYYNYYNNYYDTSYETTTTTYSSEILPYTPLLFQIFIEAEEED